MNDTLIGFHVYDRATGKYLQRETETFVLMHDGSIYDIANRVYVPKDDKYLIIIYGTQEHMRW